MAVANDHGWRPAQIVAGQFVLRTFHPAYNKNQPDLAVYIEGDGVAWVSRSIRSSDPTPDTPLTLQLAVQDPTPNRLYLARPCQYATQAELTRCDPAYWTSHRYAPEVVDSLNAAIDQAKRESGARQISLFGYSGGGNLAVLVAGQRRDVTRVVTVAGNLDHGAWTRLHRDTPLFGSLDAVDVAQAVSAIPQVHFVGSDDDVVPAAISGSFLDRSGDTSRITVINVPGADHDCCWTEKWAALLRGYVYR
ncbi:MAG: alpha/beta hydrolase [Alphaproteobacteria bacterium]